MIAGIKKTKIFCEKTYLSANFLGHNQQAINYYDFLLKLGYPSIYLTKAPGRELLNIYKLKC
jgi:hypothetical protein